MGCVSQKTFGGQNTHLCILIRIWAPESTFADHTYTLVGQNTCVVDVSEYTSPEQTFVGRCICFGGDQRKLSLCNLKNFALKPFELQGL